MILDGFVRELEKYYSFQNDTCLRTSSIYKERVQDLENIKKIAEEMLKEL